MTEVVLVQMPFGRVEAPSLALSLFKAALGLRGIGATVHYANLAWAERLGLDAFRLVEHTGTTRLVGEWLFAGPGDEAEPPPLPEGALATANPVVLGLLRSNHPHLDPAVLLRELRRRSGDFVRATAERVLAQQPRVVAASSTFQQHCASLALLRTVKELAPWTVTVIGGANCDGEMGVETCRRFPFVDYVFSGEADQSFPALCERLLRGQPPTARVVVLPGGSAHRPEEPPASCIPRFTADLDALPVPDFDDYFRELAAGSVAPFVRPSLVLEASRGCWWGQKHHCSFCGLLASSIRYRAKGPARVAEELAVLSARHGVRKVQMTDNIAEPKIVERLLPELRRRSLALTLFLETRANLKRAELEALADAGVRRIQPGIESLHDGVLGLIDKGTTAANNVRLLRDAENLGIDVVWNVLFGFSEEQDGWYAEVADWLPAIAHLRPPIGLSPVRFDRFSPHWEQQARYGLELEPLPAYRQVYGDAPETARLAYFFFDRSGRVPFAFGPDALSPPWWERMERERPGLRRFFGTASAWIRGYWGPERPRLTAEWRGERFAVDDRRVPNEPTRYEVDGLAARVLARCREDASRASLAAALEVTPAALEGAVEELLARKLLLPLSGRLVALPLFDPVRPIPPPQELPGGEVDDAAAFGFFASRGLAGELSAAARGDFADFLRSLLDQ